MNRSLTTCLAFIMLLWGMACQPPVKEQKTETSNLIKIEEGDSPEAILQKAARVVPTERQYAWQKHEFIAFLHFGVNTFTGVEWGSGKEGPSLFNPSELDTRQWVSVMKDAGMKMAMITAKHHDGFCLWPSRYTEHSVKNSPWKDGQGDVMKELSEACQDEGIKLGVYLSPADLHEIEREGGLYGNGSERKLTKIPSDPDHQKSVERVFEYELTDYDTYFMNQLYETLTEYGEISELWFDGANPKPGTGQTYNYEAWYDMIRKLQPNAVIAIKGPDVRWCGNEAGHTRKDEWSVIPFPNKPEEGNWPDMTQEDLGSDAKVKEGKYLYWYPAETNTSIRHGWFYRDEEQYVKTVNELLDTWYRSVGGNTVFLLNLTPDRRGLIPDKDAERLREVGRIVKETFAHNLAADAKAKSETTMEGHPAENALDGNLETSWQPAQAQATIELDLNGEKTFNRLVLQEDIKNHGQRIGEFEVEAQLDGQWQKIAGYTVVGYKRILRFPMVTTGKVRVKILASRATPTLANIGLYKGPEILSDPQITRSKEGQVHIACQTPDPIIYYTLDGSEPTTASTRYTQPFVLKEGGVVKARAFIGEGAAQASELIEKSFDISKGNWKLVATDEAVKNYGGDKAIDGNPSTYWHTPWDGNTEGHPHEITVDLGQKTDLKGFTYQPRTDRNISGTVQEFEFYVSEDGKNWGKAIAKGSFDNIKNNPMLQEIRFEKPVKGQFIRFRTLKEVDGKAWACVAELGVITR
ncbi:discoidin domain-containing protein [Rapidithrix thailandica]|uniref:alpha-L-fucosidase n=1 Tax=Rapidithrix thailandica TaxID=413964 RepID=A0AAW9S2Q7_9BACT